MTRADKAIRWSTIAAVLIVAAVAASFSYLHALEVVGEHSRPSIMNNAFPLTVDGLIYAGSMVLLNDARRGLAAHWLAWFALGLGISATLTVNVVSGLAYGVVGAVVSAWPAVALILSYELLMIIVRRSASAAPAASPAVPEPPAELNGHAEHAVELFGTGSVPSVRRIRREMHVGQPKAQEVVVPVRARRDFRGRCAGTRRRSSYYWPMSGRRLRRYACRRLMPWPVRWPFGWK